MCSRPASAAVTLPAVCTAPTSRPPSPSRASTVAPSCEAGEASTSSGYERSAFVRSTVAAVVAVTAAPEARATTTSFQPTRSDAYVDV